MTVTTVVILVMGTTIVLLGGGFAFFAISAARMAVLELSEMKTQIGILKVQVKNLEDAQNKSIPEPVMANIDDIRILARRLNFAIEEKKDSINFEASMLSGILRRLGEIDAPPIDPFAEGARKGPGRGRKCQ